MALNNGVPEELMEESAYLQQGAEQQGLQLDVDPEADPDEPECWWIAEMTLPDGSLVVVSHRFGDWWIGLNNPPEVNGDPSYLALGYVNGFSAWNIEDIVEELIRLLSLVQDYGSLLAADEHFAEVLANEAFVGENPM